MYAQRTQWSLTILFMEQIAQRTYSIKTVKSQGLWFLEKINWSRSCGLTRRSKCVFSCWGDPSHLWHLR